MHIPSYDHAAKRQTVSITLNADLVARSLAHGLNISRIAEAVLVTALKAVEKAAIQEERQENARFVTAYVAKHGYPFPASIAGFIPEQEDNEAA